MLEHRSSFADFRFVSKNVCHGVVWDRALHDRAPAAVDAMPADSRPRAAWDRIVHGMGRYLAAHPGGKALHDPLAAACAVDPAVGSWAEVEVYRAHGEWGARLAPGSGVRIIVDHDPERFFRALLGQFAVK